MPRVGFQSMTSAVEDVSELRPRDHCVRRFSSLLLLTISSLAPFDMIIVNILR
jgi:hypothetical protein